MKLENIILATLLASSALFAGVYKVDIAHSSVAFKVKHLMISNVKGTFSDYSGTFEYDEKSKKLKSLSGIVKVDSIDTGIEKRDEHLKSEEIFNAEKYPEITFKLLKVEGDKAYGEFTMHGVTKEVKFDYDNGGTIKDPWGNTRAGISLSGKIDRRDYGVSWNKILEAGGLTISDEVKLEVELEGILQK
ncbi:YceI family protein [bacterium]|nr:YceI family protein [bacterium]MBU1994130.1 YceI family protein [bacterium]